WNRRVLVAREELPPNLCAALLLSDGYIARLQGDFVSANASLNESLAFARALDDQRTAGNALGHLAYVALAQERFEDADRLFAACLDMHQADNDRDEELYAMTGQASLAYAQGDYERHERLTKRALRLAQELGSVDI